MQNQSVQVIDNGNVQASHMDILATEVPIALEFNGVSHVVMMASPSDLTDFAIGFAFCEGIIQQRSDVYAVDVEAQPNGIVLRIHIANACFVKLKEKRRTLMGRTGCGLCGVESLDYFQSQNNAPIVSASQLNLSLLNDVLHAFDQSQPLRAQTGASHAAAWVSWAGQMEWVREDVGRHNALDKLIGVLMQQSAHADAGFVLVSSRASFEMVEKTARWGASCLVAVSAATSRAVQCAIEHNIQLIGFARPNRAVQYTFGANHE